MSLPAIDFQLAELWPHMLKPSTVESQASHLHFEVFGISKVARPIDIVVKLFFHSEFLRLIALSGSSLHLLSRQFTEQPRLHNSGDRLTKWVHLSELAKVAHKFGNGVDV